MNSICLHLDAKPPGSSDHKVSAVCELLERNTQQQSWGSEAPCESWDTWQGCPGCLPACALLHTWRRIALVYHISRYEEENNKEPMKPR